MINLDECFVGTHISTVCTKACEIASAKNEDVWFSFNETEVVVHPGDSPERVQEVWEQKREEQHEAWLASPEYKKRQEELAAEDLRKRSAVLTESAQTEAEMRDAASPWPYTEKQLIEYIGSLIDRQHDYGTCVYAMSLAATAAFNYVAGVLGTTGFQASSADLDVIRRTRHIEGPFSLFKAQDALYPQYDPEGRLAEQLKSWRPWLKERAEKNLAETQHAHPDAIAHWRKLAAFEAEPDPAQARDGS